MSAAQTSGYRHAKTLGVRAITASAVAAEYGAGINFVSMQSLSVYPAVHGLVPLAMFVTGIAMLLRRICSPPFPARCHVPDQSMYESRVALACRPGS